MLRSGLGKRTVGGGEAAPRGKVFGTGQAGPVTLGWVTYQTSAPSWYLTPLSNRTWSEKGCVETSPNSGWGLQKLEETWNVQSPNSAPALAPALMAQPLPSRPT